MGTATGPMRISVNVPSRFVHLLVAVLLVALCLPMAFADGGADMVWVRKSERMLYLLKDYGIIASYPIALGKQPVGHKLVVGDSRTPEGLYQIDWRNPNSKFYLSLHITYPNTNDLRRAALRGVDAGDDIMIHGRPDNAEHGWSETGPNWTDGCIALSNRDMQAVWDLVADGTPILIDP